jgi:hypothetical protein
VASVPRLIEKENADRASMVYTTPCLSELLNSVVRALGGCTERDLAKIFEILLTSWLPTFLDQPEDYQISAPDRADGSLEMLDMTTSVRSFVGSTDEIDRTLLLCKSQGISDGEIGARLNRSRPWVASRKVVILGRVGDELMADLPADHHSSAMNLLLAEISARATEGEVSDGDT